MFDVDTLTDSQIDRLNDRLTARFNQRNAEKAAAERAKSDPRPLRPQIGDAGILFGNELARRNWDEACIAALQTQRAQYVVAPMASVMARDGKRLLAGQEVRPSEHIDARLGDPLVQMARLVASGHVLERADYAVKAGAA